MGLLDSMRFARTSGPLLLSEAAMFDSEPSYFNALMSGVLIGTGGTLFWVFIFWVTQ